MEQNVKKNHNSSDALIKSEVGVPTEASGQRSKYGAKREKRHKGFVQNFEEILMTKPYPPKFLQLYG